MYKTIQMTQILKKVWVVLVLTSFITHAQDATISNDLWHHQDLKEDSIPGVSLNKAYKELLKDKKGQEIIVAVLDSGFDINHEDLKDNIWVNKDENPNNNIDDDKNGYIDDIHGWNFLGNKNGENIIYSNFEFVRFIRKYKPYFKDRDTTNFSINDRELFKTYKKALIDYKSNITELEDDKKYIVKFERDQNKAKQVLLNYFPDGNYTVEDIYKIDVKGDEELKKHLINRIKALYHNLDDLWIMSFKKDITSRENYKLDLKYDSRQIIEDNLENINNKYYGNNDIIGDLTIESHGTNVSGLIAANRNNDIGIKGISNNIKIMPLRVIPQGDEYDKDIALAMRYAVDNGAKIINMSFGKEYSMNTKLVLDAIKYADKNHVLIVSAAGNEALDIDVNNYYPNDCILNTKTEVANNFIKVGSTSHNLDNTIYSSFSNYGKMNVDLFAPGDNIHTTSPKNKYETNGGTSFSSPIVSGIAALTWSHYPKITVSEMKKILIQSGNSYNIEVEIEQQDGTKKMVPFSELSKSGKIVNAYNALLMAEEINKGKE